MSFFELFLAGVSLLIIFDTQFISMGSSNGNDDDTDTGDDPVTRYGTDQADNVDLGDGSFPTTTFIYDAGEGNDTIQGSSVKEIIDVGNGDDSVNAGSSYDAVIAGEGQDTVMGDSGYDLIIGGGGGDLLYGGSTSTQGNYDGLDMILGEGDNDTIIGGFQSDTLFGGLDSDLLQGNNGQDYLDGSSYTDRNLSLEDALQLMNKIGWDENFSGAPDLFQIKQSEFASYIRDNFTVTLDDNAADTLDGGEGADTLILASQDTGTGGSGDDNFYAFTSNSGMSAADIAAGATYQAPTITDFDQTDDRLYLLYDDSQTATTPDSSELTTPSQGGNTLLQWNGQTVAILVGTVSLDLNQVIFVDQAGL